MTQEALEAKREQLEDLEKSEREARRLEEALSNGRSSGFQPPLSQGDDGGDGEQQVVDENEARRQDESQSAYLPPHPGPSPVRRRAPGMGFLSALSYTLHGMMDVDPETARRNSITKTRETISQVCAHTHACKACADDAYRVVAGGRAALVGAGSQVLELDDSSGLGPVPATEGG